MLSDAALQDVADWALDPTNLDGTYNGYFVDDCTDFASRALHFGGGVPETEPQSLKDANSVARGLFWLPMGIGVDAAYAYIKWSNDKVRTDLSNWYEFGFYGYHVASDSWAVAPDLAAHEVQEGASLLVNGAQSTACSSSDDKWDQVRPGDIIFADFNGSSFSQIDHTAIVLGWNPNGQPSSYTPGATLYVAQHSPSQVTTLNYWLSKDSSTHIWIFNPADR
jgi:hypothetical protein